MGSIWFAQPDITNTTIEWFLVGMIPMPGLPARTAASDPDLEMAGLVKRVERRAAHGGRQTNMYDLDGLVARLKRLEPDFREVDEAAKDARRAVSKRGYRRNRIRGESKTP